MTYANTKNRIREQNIAENYNRVNSMFQINQRYDSNTNKFRLKVQTYRENQNILINLYILSDGAD